MAYSTLTSKGQVTIPAAIRQALRLKAGTTMRVARSGNKVIFEAVGKSGSARAGARVALPKGTTWKDVDDAMNVLRHGNYEPISKRKNRR